MACHSHDPDMPPSGYRGIDRAPDTVDGMKKFIEIVDSSYYGLNFCQGTFSEMCRRPRQEDLHGAFPEHSRQASELRGDIQRAYTAGYIKALIKAINNP